MSEPLTPNRHAGDPCPPDMFDVQPPEAFRGAHFLIDVELIGEQPPYHVRYHNTDDDQAAIYLDIDPAFFGSKVDGQGLFVENMATTPAGYGIRLGPPVVNEQPVTWSPTQPPYDYRLRA